VVRDAGRAAEVVMKWAAPAELAAAVEEEPAVEPEAPEPEVAAASDAAEPEDTLTERAVVEHAAHERRRDLGAGIVGSPSSYGVRIEADALLWRSFALGIRFGVGDAAFTSGDAMTGATVDLRDVSTGLFLAKTFGSGAWRFRVQAGYGFVYTRYTAKARTAPFAPLAEGSGTTRMIDASLALSREISESWAVQVGPLFQYYAQTFNLDASKPTRTFDIGGYLAIKMRI
jgi:hypothetical protein